MITNHAVNCPNCGGFIELSDVAPTGKCQYCGTKVSIYTDTAGDIIRYDANKESLPECLRLFKIGNFSALEKYCDETIEQMDGDFVCAYYKGVCLFIKGEMDKAYEIWCDIFDRCNDRELCVTIYEGMTGFIVNSKIAQYSAASKYPDNYEISLDIMDYLNHTLKDCRYIEYEDGDLFLKILDSTDRKILEYNDFDVNYALMCILMSIVDNVIYSRVPCRKRVVILERVYVTEKKVLHCIDPDNYQHYEKWLEHNISATRYLSMRISSKFSGNSRYNNNFAMGASLAEVAFTRYLVGGLQFLKEDDMKQVCDSIDEYRNSFNEKTYVRHYQKAHEMCFTHRPFSNRAARSEMEGYIRRYLNGYLKPYYTRDQRQ